MAIFRGTGGAGDSTDDSIVSEVTEQAGIATTKAQEAATSATNASNSASSASSSETAASNSATAAAGSASTATTKASEAASHASDALASKNAAATSATAAADSATAANSANVQTVAGLSTEITNLNGIRTDITGVNAVRADVVTVSGISSDVTTVAADASDIGTVATNITNVNNVGDNISNVNAVHSNASNINTVAADGSDIGTVAGNISNVNTVAGISSDVTTVAGLESKMDAVIADASDIGAVAGNIGNVNTVAGDSSDINTVAGISADVTSVADNMTDVQNADTNAANAATSASNASDSASAASTSASNASSSASSASTSATNAGNSASAASNSATAASGSASAASGSASAASGSASAAASSASAASTSASNAATSETNSEGSENASALSATAAATSASNAATSESNAATSATNAAVSETNAAASETNAAASYDSFDDRYLGVKSSAPAADNDGGDLLTGALYFNSTSNTMFVFTGSAWNAVANNNIINPNVALTQDLATNGNDVKFGDNDKATFGAGDDLQIYHDGSHSYIKDLGTGNLNIQSNGVGVVIADTSASDLAVFNAGSGVVTLFKSGAPKLATTSTGIDVTGTATMDGLVSAGAASFSNNGSENLFLADTANVSRSSLQISGAVNYFNANIDSASHGQFVWRSSNAYTERMRIDSSGRVGIGTSSPSYALDLQNANGGVLARFKDSDSSHNGIVIAGDVNAGWVGNSSSTTGEGIYYQNSLNAMRLYTNGTERMRIDSSGIISFSETSSASFPASSINAYTNGYTYLTGGEHGLVLKDAGASGSRVQINAATMQFETNATERMRIDSSGNVGIGTSSPAGKLDVLAGSDQRLIFTTLGTDPFISAVNGANSAYKPLQLNGSDMKLMTGGSERMRIDSHGTITQTTSSASPVSANFVTGNSNCDITMNSANTSSLTRLRNGTNDFQIHTNGSEAMRIDSSGNMLVGKTSQNLATEGISINPLGYIQVTENQSPTLYLNRLSTDGSIINFYKDGTTVGSINAAFGFLSIGNADTGLLFDGTSETIKPWNVGNTSARDAAIDLGGSTDRFQDLYLSGGVYLGGTGAANKLDDYEEGTWTPTVKAGGTLTIDTIGGATYTKIGRSVTVQGYITLNNDGNASSTFIEGLPFNGIVGQYFTGPLTHSNGSNTADTMYIRQNANTAELGIHRGHNTNVAQSEIDGGWVIFSVTYQTDS